MNDRARQPFHADLQSYLEGLLEGFVAYDRCWVMTYMNAAAERLLGRNRKDVLGLTWHQAFPHAVGGPVDLMYQRVMRSRAAERMEYDYSAPYRKWFEISASPIEGGGVGVYFRDISDRVRADEALRESQARLRESEATLRAFYESSPVCMGVTELTEDGADVLHIFDNPAACRLFGVPKGATAGRRAAAELGADAAVLRRWTAAYQASEASGAPVRFEHACHKPNGVRWLAATVSTIGRGPSGRTRFCYVAEDITERRAADAVLRRQAAIFENQNDAIIVTDLEGRMIEFNPAAERMTGYARAEAIGRNTAMFHRPEVAGSLTRDVLAAMSRDGEWRGEVVFLRKDGSVGVCDTVVKPLADENGRVIGAIGVNHDITDRKRADEALRESEQRLRLALQAGRMGTWEWHLPSGRVNWSPDLESIHGYEPGEFPGTVEAYSAEVYPDDRPYVERVIGETLAGKEHLIEYRIVRRDGAVRWVEGRGKLFRDAEGNPLRLVGVCADVTARKDAEASLRESEDRHRTLAHALREADRRKDEFLATLAHELRNPLAPISNAVQLLKAKKPQDPDIVWGREVIERQLRQMSRLLDDLLDVSRITRGKVDLRKDCVPLSAVIESAVETSRPLIDGGRHELEVTLPGEPVLVQADPVRLAQVFSNLLNNAAKYTPDGGHIQVHARRCGDDVLISVSDNGIGLASDMLSLVFEMFTQAEPARERSRGGLGIGLSLARALVEMHGGRMEAHSEGPGRGAQFVVRLPVAAQGARPFQEPPVTPLRLAVAQRLLIVDDLKDSADSLAMLTQALGCEVRVAYDGETALAAGDEMRPDIVFLDLGMPGMSGYDTCREMRRRDWGRGAFIVALSGWGQDEDRRRTESAGFDEHVVKPPERERLVELLSSRSLGERRKGRSAGPKCGASEPAPEGSR